MLSSLIICILFYILVSRLDCNTWRQLSYVYIIMLSVLLQQCFYKYVPHGIILVYIHSHNCKGHHRGRVEVVWIKLFESGINYLRSTKLFDR